MHRIDGWSMNVGQGFSESVGRQDFLCAPNERGGHNNRLNRTHGVCNHLRLRRDDTSEVRQTKNDRVFIKVTEAGCVLRMISMTDCKGVI